MSAPKAAPAGAQTAPPVAPRSRDAVLPWAKGPHFGRRLAQAAAPRGILSRLGLRRPRLHVTTEHSLIASGFAIALASGAFGIYMNLQPGPMPDGEQAQYWSVFAQLARGHWPTRTVASADGAEGLPANLDPVVTGTIGRAAQERSALPSQAVAKGAAPGALDGYFVRDVFDGMALVESRYGLTLVKPGGVLLGAGHVDAIEQRDGKWVVVTSKGTIRTETK